MEITSLPLLTAITCCSLAATAMAQFKVDFTAKEGYSDGPLAANSNRDWIVFDQSNADSDCFAVDPTGSGTLVIDPSEPGFQVAAYKGEGERLTTNIYHGQISFRLRFSNGKASVPPESPPILPTVQFINMNNQTEAILFGLRQIPAREPGGTTFNIFSGNTLNGKNESHFSLQFDGSKFGLEVDTDGNWTDGESDLLTLRFDAVKDADNQWTETVTLTNADTSSEIASITRVVTDDDGSFAANDHRFRIYPLHIEGVEVAIRVDHVAVDTGAE